MKWKDLDGDEVQTFLANLLVLGIYKRNSWFENWRVDDWERSIIFNYISEKIQSHMEIFSLA